MEVKGDLNIDGELTVNGSPVSGGSGINNVVEDTTPQLGGELDTNGNAIISADVTGGTTPQNIDVRGGDAETRSGASIHFTAGNSVDNSGGNVEILGGNSDNFVGGNVTIQPGFVPGNGPAQGVVYIGLGSEVNFPGVIIQDAMTMSGHNIINLADPVDLNDAATKNYVDNQLGASPGNIITAEAFYIQSGGELSHDDNGVLLEAPTGQNITLTADNVVILSTNGQTDIEGTTGITFNGPSIIFNGSPLSQVGEPIASDDAATKNYVDTHSSPGGGGSGFYGIVWSDGVTTKRTDRLSFARPYFYLDGYLPTVNLKESGIDHNQLANLTAGDPHTQYIRVDGTRAFTGDNSHGGFKITNLGAPSSPTDAARLTDIGPGFYGVVIKQSSGANPTFKTDTIIFGSPDFYMKSDSKGKPVIRLRAAGGSGSSSGISGIDFSDGVHNLQTKTKLNLNPAYFYLSQTSNGDPMANLRYDRDVYPIYIDFPTTQQVAVDPWAQYPYTIEKVDFDCLSGSATGGFYIIRAANRSFARDGTGVSGMDPLNISNTPTTKLATGANTVNVGDVVQFSLYQNSSARRVRIVLTCKKP